MHVNADFSAPVARASSVLHVCLRTPFRAFFTVLSIPRTFSLHKNFTVFSVLTCQSCVFTCRRKFFEKKVQFFEATTSSARFMNGGFRTPLGGDIFEVYKGVPPPFSTPPPVGTPPPPPLD